MSDKAKRSHIETAVYVSPDVAPGSELRYGSWSTSPTEWREHTELMTRILPAEGSDYSGSLVEHSNFRVLKKEFPWLVTLHGGHGTFGLAYLGRRENQSDALIEMIDSLTDYPIASEDDHSELECERECEEWGSHGQQDFNRALMNYLDTIDPEHAHELHDGNAPYPDAGMVLLDLWRDGCEVFNVNGGSGYINEQGDQIHFMIDDWMRFSTDTRYAKDADKAPYRGDGRTMRERLNELATLTRDTEQS